MKQIVIKASATAGLLLLVANIALASTIDLTNGGLGQVAGDVQEFGVSVCNNGKTDLDQAVPVIVTANGRSATTLSASTIATGDCEYSYVPYSQFNMKAGQTYGVSVIIDPQHLASTNSDNATVYEMTIPKDQPTTKRATNLTADISSQLQNPLVELWNWLGDLYQGI